MTTLFTALGEWNGIVTHDADENEEMGTENDTVCMRMHYLDGTKVAYDELPSTLKSEWM